MPRTETVDILILGSGNAGLSAATSAALAGARTVLVLDKAPRDWAGGNTTFTAGAYRTVFHGLSDVLPLVRNVDAATAATIDMDPYTEADFHADLDRVTGGRADPALAAALVGESRETTRWLAREVGVPFELSFHRQAYEVGGRTRFWGGMVLAVEGGGKGLTRAHLANCARRGAEVRFGHAAVGLVVAGGCPGGAVLGRRARAGPTARRTRCARAAASCSPPAASRPRRRAARARLGAGWDAAHVRGTPYNTGELLDVAVRAAGAATAGHWGGCHSTCWDAGAPRHEGDRELTNAFTKSGYPLGLMVNARGERFVDEGQDMRNFTYAKFGREVLRQPGGVAWQLWDARGASWLRKEEYAPEVTRRIEARRPRRAGGEARRRRARGRGRRARHRRRLQRRGPARRRRGARGRRVRPVAQGRRVDAHARRRRRRPRARQDQLGAAARRAALPRRQGRVRHHLHLRRARRRPGHGGRPVGPGRARPSRGCTSRGRCWAGCSGDNYPGVSGLTAGAVVGRKAGREAARRAVEARTKL